MDTSAEREGATCPGALSGSPKLRCAGCERKIHGIPIFLCDQRKKKERVAPATRSLVQEVFLIERLLLIFVKKHV